MQKDLWMRCASSFYVGMHEWRTCKWCWTKCDPSSVFGNLTGTFLPNVNVSGEHDRCCVVINLNVNQYSKDKRRPKGISNPKGKGVRKILSENIPYQLLCMIYLIWYLSKTLFTKYTYALTHEPFHFCTFVTYFTVKLTPFPLID